MSQVNRIRQELGALNSEIQQYIEDARGNAQGNSELQKERLKRMRYVYYKYRFAAKSKEEKASLHFLAAEIRGMEKNVSRPFRLPFKPRGLIGMALSLTLGAVIIPLRIAFAAGRAAYRNGRGYLRMRAQDKADRHYLNQLNTQLSQMGFSSDVSLIDRQALRQDQDKLPLSLYQRPGERMDVNLQFRTDEQGRRQLDGFEATLKNEQQPELNRRQYFPFDNGRGFNAQEAYHLLSGRSINRQFLGADGQVSSTWVSIDLENKDAKGNHLYRQFGTQYGYDLNAALKSVQAKELTQPDRRAEIIRALQAGERVSITMKHNGKEVPRYMEADLPGKTVRFFDEQQMPLSHQQIQAPTQAGLQQAKPAPALQVAHKKVLTPRQKLAKQVKVRSPRH